MAKAIAPRILKQGPKVTPQGPVAQAPRVTSIAEDTKRQSSNLFEVLGTAMFESREREQMHSLPNAISRLEEELGTNLQLITELGNELRTVLNGEARIEDETAEGVSFTHQSVTVNRIESLADCVRNQNRILNAIINALEL